MYYCATQSYFTVSHCITSINNPCLSMTIRFVNANIFNEYIVKSKIQKNVPIKTFKISSGFFPCLTEKKLILYIL